VIATEQGAEVVAEIPFGVPRIEVGMTVVLETADGRTIVQWDENGSFESVVSVERGMSRTEPASRGSERGVARAR
jgi:hypothetical protein